MVDSGGSLWLLAAIVGAYRRAMARLGEQVLRLMLLGPERVRVELEHLEVWVEDMYNRRTEGAVSRKPADRSRVSADKLESSGEGRRVSGADQARVWHDVAMCARAMSLVCRARG